VRRFLLVVVISIAVAGCGASPESATSPPDARAPEIPAHPPATLAGLLGPWQPVPYQLDVAFRTRAEEACWRDMEVRPGPLLTTVDARGGSVVIVRVRGGDMAVCHALQVLPTGDITGAGSGESGWPLQPPVAGPWDLENIKTAAIEGGDLKVQGWSVHGQAGAGIRLVIVHPAQGPALVATLENGWFAAWWPTQLPGQADGPRLPLPHFVVEGYDAAQDLRATIRQ
jgi:hypothetical protein